MDKYYTPDVSELFVGYECEEQLVTTYDLGTKSERTTENWYPTRIIHIHNHQHPRLKNPVYRTPYLTKEQIEAEGWLPYKGETLIAFSKEDHYLWYSNFSNLLSIEKGKWPSRRTRFSGECKSINEFRYICKLLGI